jgi:hypothetical protein
MVFLLAGKAGVTGADSVVAATSFDGACEAADWGRGEENAVMVVVVDIVKGQGGFSTFIVPDGAMGSGLE